MNQTKKILVAVGASLLFLTAMGQSRDNWSKVDKDQLKNWKFYGRGEVGTFGEQYWLKEAAGSKGVMIVSPELYMGDVIMRYKVFALTPATVVVAMTSISDRGASEGLTVAPDYDGSIGLWMNDRENYFFAFKNASHGLTPFLTKNPGGGKIATADANVMIAGKYYQVEVGQREGKLWLSIDGVRVMETEDADPLSGGHLAIRLRGTAGFPAGCLIKELEIAN